MTGLSFTSGSLRASVISSGRLERIACWHAECAIGIPGVEAHGSRGPTQLAK
jgi:hypothetical protein